MNKTIAIICDHRLSATRIGGMEHFYKMLNNNLIEEGFSVDWFFTYYDGFEFLSSLNIISAEGQSVEERFVQVSKKEKNIYCKIVTHFTVICSPYYKEYSKLHSTAKIIAVDHNPRPIEGFSLIKKIKNYLKSLMYSRFITNFIAVSEYSKLHLIKDFSIIIKNKICIIHNGISVDKIVKKEEYNTNTNFIVTAHLRKIKGIQDLIKAVLKLPIQISEKVKVTVFGEGPYEQELKLLVKENGLQNQIDFKGSVSDLHQRYASYDYLIHPSYGETYCYSVVESLTAKLPVITTNNIGNVLQLVKENKNGFLFEAGDIMKLSNIIEDIVSSKKSISSKTFQEAEIPDMSIQRMVREHTNIIRCI